MIVIRASTSTWKSHSFSCYPKTTMVYKTKWNTSLHNLHSQVIRFKWSTTGLTEYCQQQNITKCYFLFSECHISDDTIPAMKMYKAWMSVFCWGIWVHGNWHTVHLYHSINNLSLRFHYKQAKCNLHTGMTDIHSHYLIPALSYDKNYM